MARSWPFLNRSEFSLLHSKEKELKFYMIYLPQESVQNLPRHSHLHSIGIQN